jgi:hypothetical protein
MDWRTDFSEDMGFVTRLEGPIQSHRRGCTNQIPSETMQGIRDVVLCNMEGEEVAYGNVQDMEPGDFLQGLALRPSEEAILIKTVMVPTEEVHELYMHTMAECLEKVIRWPKQQLQELEHNRACNEAELPPSSLVSSEDEEENFSIPPTMSFSDSIGEFSFRERQRRPYNHHMRPHRRPPGPRIIGMSRTQKVSLLVVLADKEKVLCSQRCLHDIDANDICILRCQALKSSTYGERSTWLINTLRGFMTRITTMTSSREHLKCITRIKGKRVCNACFAMAIGYSRRGLVRLIAEIRDNNRHTSIHGNRQCRREKNKVTMARALFEQYIKDFGELQPHRQCRRKMDGMMFQMVCLPMNVRKGEIWMTINSKLHRLGEPRIGLPTFHKLWKHEFTYIHIPKTSRFSKCNTCWEYKNFKQSVPIEELREASSNEYRVHLDIVMEERMEYNRGRTAAISQPDEYLSLIIDGMDQNTTWVPSFRQSVKGIESRYLKTHLCGVLVHGIGLYCHIWIDAHHKHDNNQVVTSIMKVLQDVKRRRSRLPPHLRIQADNCGRENKNVYMLALCATLVALGFSKKFNCSF